MREFHALWPLEPKQSSAYHIDLRWQMVWQRIALNKLFTDIASNLCIDQATVKRIVDLFESTGDVLKRPYPKHRLQRKLTLMAELILLTIVIEQPGIKLKEMQVQLKDYGIEVSESTISNFLHRSGFSDQRMVLIAKQRDEDLRMAFANDVSMYDSEMLEFIDETGADRRNTIHS